MKIFDSNETARALPYARLVAALADAVRELSNGEVRAPERQVIPLGGNAVLLTMPAIGRDIGVTKLITVHGDNAQRQLPAIQGEVVVFDVESGKRLALLDGPTVTARRTAAMTLLGIQTLTTSPPSSAVLIGCGVQATAHAEALVAYFGVSRFQVTSRNPKHAEAFCSALRTRHSSVQAKAFDISTLDQRCQHAELVIALTTSREPVVPIGLPAHTLAVGVGAFKPEMAELPAGLLHERQIVVDHLEGACHEAGDLLQAGLDWNRVRELGEVMAQGVRPASAAPVLKTVGHAAWDLAAARVALQSVR